ncbi:MAG: glycosyl transferase [Rhodobiaceae bacterium]|nr:glycosyl transferase [Rhodobiaceae bacterium]MCC0048744.1 glycosyl transferase [Rhodobiaceae bacterium]
MTTSLLFYVQHLLGIGHVYRARRICDALHDAGFGLTLVTGGLPVKILAEAPFPVVQLPPLRTSGTDFAGLVDDNGKPAGEDYMTRRREMLLGFAADIQPDIVITEAYPFGRRQMRHELMPFIRFLKDRGDAKLFASIRDILQENRKPGRDAETVNLLNTLYDGVLVHGDPHIAKLADTFPLAAEIAIPVHHTGMVAPPAPPTAPVSNEVLVSAGGGAVGEALLTAAASAANDGRLSHLKFVLSTGPNLPGQARERLRRLLPANAETVPFIENLPQRLAGCALSVSQAGYNTVADILVAGTRAVLVPFATDGETEQTVRSLALEKLGRTVHLAESGLTPANLAGKMLQALSVTPDKTGIDLDGARTTASILKSL